MWLPVVAAYGLEGTCSDVRHVTPCPKASTRDGDSVPCTEDANAAELPLVGCRGLVAYHAPSGATARPRLIGYQVGAIWHVWQVGSPSWRASAVGVYRLWRDAGFAVGALAAGLIADRLGMPAAIWAVTGLTAASGLVVVVRMYDTHPVARGIRETSPT